VISGSVSTQLKCDEIFKKNYIIANYLHYVLMKKFLKLVNTWRRYGKWQSGRFWGYSVDVVTMVTHHDHQYSCAAPLCVNAAGRVEAQRAENGRRRPIVWQRSSGQEA